MEKMMNRERKKKKRRNRKVHIKKVDQRIESSKIEEGEKKFQDLHYKKFYGAAQHLEMHFFENITQKSNLIS